MAQPTNSEFLGPDIDLLLTEMWPEKYNAMPVDMNNSEISFNTGVPRAPNVETSTITLFSFDQMKNMFPFTQKQIQSCITRVCNLYLRIHLIMVCWIDVLRSLKDSGYVQKSAEHLTLIYSNARLNGHIWFWQLGMTCYVLAKSNQSHWPLSLKRGKKGSLNSKFLLHNRFPNEKPICK